MKITPDPRILAMLGEIEIAEWQCLAEFVDNSIDELMRRNGAREELGDPPVPQEDNCVEVYLPELDIADEQATVEVRDRGRGMSGEQLNQAVRAGWTGNDPFSNLGLFGMGFNVATARLGRVTEVLTTRSGDPDWIGVRIDLQAIGADFEAPELRRPKDDPADHGTRIIVSSLDPDRCRQLKQRSSRIKRQLGQIYSWILLNTPLTVRVNGELAPPKRPCIWDDSRSVTRGRGRNQEEIPAVIRFDQSLSDAVACADCGAWQEPGRESCRRCRSQNLVVRTRRIHGWVGIQRYLDGREYGIDFLRNGRKILVHDKSLFNWTDPNDAFGEELHEYPIEIPANEGRIVGEVHLDHVPIDYKKDRFEESSREWKAAVLFLRGAGPFRPRYAKERGYEDKNTSPLGRLWRGYNENDPGSRCLMPGDGDKRLASQVINDWVKRFERGDSEYQTDQKWWEAVLEHDRRQAQKQADADSSESGQTDVDAVRAALGGVIDGNGMTNNASPDKTRPPKPTSIREYAELLRGDSRPIAALSADYRSLLADDVISVEAWEVPPGAPRSNQGSDSHAPVWILKSSGGKADLFVDMRHEAFTKQGFELLDLAIATVADLMRTQQDLSVGLAELMWDIRRESFSESDKDFPRVQASTRRVLRAVRERLMEGLQSNDPRTAWALLDEHEISQVEQRFASQGKIADSAQPSFIEYVPALFLVRLLEARPELFLDGVVFNQAYLSLSTDAAKQTIKSRLVSLLSDCAILASAEDGDESMSDLRRTLISVELLERLLAG